LIAGAVADTSVAIALTLGDHVNHRAAVRARRDHQPALAGHARFESYSVLTRLPDAQRLSPTEAGTALHRNFPETAWLSARQMHALTGHLIELGITGGAVYDALVADAANAASLPLLTADHRAIPTYERLGVTLILIA